MRALALTTVLGLACAGCATSQRAQTETPVEITLKNGTPDEEAARKQLERLLQTYDLDPWIQTRQVVIEAYVIPHSHPVLTLNTRLLDDDVEQLSTFIHEQAHRFVSARDAAEAAAVAAFRDRYPEVPVGRPEGGRNEESTYSHLIVCWLELDAMTELIGEGSARALMAEKPRYRWIYERVLSNTAEIGAVLAEHDLLIRSGG